ncbi:type II secretion system assembly protein PulN [Desulfuromonas soudanensis]|uniref:Type II secretion system assembly protein PulN n=1 Tax=Desulfuromonas soudanensis TaxID=1603606 RepID=A0A0M4D2G4_9BACT|nr:PilN domain-containing protein [Desulfuromonas soudanensis]ALC17171.1 type II secretion system assembly protein PulN [Desulfuromonas soudanensis]
MNLNLNLASRAYVNRQALFLCYTLLIALLTVFLLLLGNSYYRLHADNGRIAAQLEEINRDLGFQGSASQEITSPAYQKLQERVALANQLLVKDSFRWTALLDHLEEVVTDGVRIRSIQPDYRQGGLKLIGVARGLGDLRSFLDRLIASPHFSEVFLLDQASVAIKDNLGQDHSSLTFTIDLKGAF